VRLAAGDRAVLFDGAGVAVTAEVISARGDRVELRVLERHSVSPELTRPITLAPAVLKGDAMDALIRDATMLGAAAIAPVITARTVVPASVASAERTAERWRRIALASAKQCGRDVLPDIGRGMPLAAALGEQTWALARRLVLCEPDIEAGSALPAPSDATQPTVILSGPEGGWTRDEIAQAAAHGWHAWRCSRLVLRAEMAPAVALGILAWESGQT
jgi:16S rRNA (uracil1498-N3)-methyltransferase